MSNKRNRSVNWDEEEKQLFRCVLKDYAQIIEDKTLNTNTNKIKVRAWEEVYKKFNSLNSRKRELSQLKIQWKGMKVNARKTYSTCRKESNKTGGGERPATPDDDIIQVKDLLNPGELLKDENIFDSDGIVFNPPQSSKDEDKVFISLTHADVLPDSQKFNWTFEETDTQKKVEQRETDDIEIDIQIIDSQMDTPILIQELNNPIPATPETGMKKTRKIQPRNS